MGWATWGLAVPPKKNNLQFQWQLSLSASALLNLWYKCEATCAGSPVMYYDEESRMENFESQCARTCSSCCSRCCAFCKAKRSCWPSNETWLCSGQQMLCPTQKTQTYSECKEWAKRNYQCFWSTITHFDLAHAALKVQVFWKGTLLYKKTTEATQNNRNCTRKSFPTTKKIHPNILLGVCWNPDLCIELL